jgi:hypothetical protein
MMPYAPVYSRRMGQAPGAAPAPAPVAPPAPAVTVAPAGYTGFPGVIEILSVLTISGAAAWVGVRTGMTSKKGLYQIAGYVGGIGSALLGLMYLGSKSGVSQQISLPQVRIVR